MSRVEHEESGVRRHKQREAEAGREVGFLGVSVSGEIVKVGGEEVGRGFCQYHKGIGGSRPEDPAPSYLCLPSLAAFPLLCLLHPPSLTKGPSSPPPTIPFNHLCFPSPALNLFCPFMYGFKRKDGISN